MKSKKGAIELSVGTIVIIVLAMTMLILGIVLIRNIFTGTITNVDEINEGVRDQIKKLFQNENDRAVIYLTGKTAEVDKGEDYGIAFGVRNIKTGDPDPTVFKYETVMADSDSELREACGVNVQTAEDWIRFGSGEVTVRPGEIGFPPVPIRIQLPETAPLCTTRYSIKITEKATNDHYETIGFILKIT